MAWSGTVIWHSLFQALQDRGLLEHMAIRGLQCTASLHMRQPHHAYLLCEARLPAACSSRRQTLTKGMEMQASRRCESTLAQKLSEQKGRGCTAHVSVSASCLLAALCVNPAFTLCRLTTFILAKEEPSEGCKLNAVGPSMPHAPQLFSAGVSCT